MKKSLILSVVMTLVLVVSMSTATFAWYTSNNQATVTANTITAQSTSGNLRVDVFPDTPGDTVTNPNQSQAYYTVSGLFEPTAPIQGEDLSVASNWVHNTGSTEINLERCGSNFTNYVETGSIIVTDDSHNITQFKITVGVDGPAGNEGKFNCIVTDQNGSIVAKTAYNSVNSANFNQTVANDASLSSFIAMNLTGVTLNYYIWFDGPNMTNADGGKQFNVTFTFVDSTPNA